jgi:hypothetical protein
MRCHGMHCDGCGHGDWGGPAGAVIVLLVIIAVALRKAWPAIVSAVEIAAWTVAGLSGAALVVTAGVLTTKAVRRHRARRVLAYRPGYPFVVVVDEAQEWFAGQFPADGRPGPGEIEPPTDAPRWPVTGWQSGGELRPRIGGDGDDRRRR